MVCHPERRVARPHQGLDLGLVAVVQRNELPAGYQGLERVLILFGDLVDTNLRASAPDHFDVVPPVGRQVGDGQPLFGGLDDLQAVVLGRHFPMKHPHDVAAGVDLTGEVEARFGRHHSQDAAGQSGVLGVVFGGYAFGDEIDVEVDAAAPRAAADFDVGQGTGRLLDLLQFLVGDPNTLGVPGDGVKVEAEPQGSTIAPSPPRHADALGMQGKWEAEVIVGERGVGGGIPRTRDIEPFVDAI